MWVDRSKQFSIYLAFKLLRVLNIGQANKGNPLISIKRMSNFYDHFL